MSLVATWCAKRRAQAEHVCIDLLAGRGTGDDIWTDGERVLHLRRRLSDEEIAALPAWWMAIKPIDMG